MIHIHPFPARMAPEIALNKLKTLPQNAIVLDPMCGSGMVISQSARASISAIGCDLDPLARLMSHVGSRRVSEAAVWRYLEELLTYCKRNERSIARLDWIDSDQPTKDFISYWFDPRQEKQLRRIAKFIARTNFGFTSNPKNVIAIALSRLIVTKEPKASLARDTAHSRPHKTIECNEFDIYANMKKSVRHVLKALDTNAIKVNSKTYLADARRLSRIPSNSVDAIITSPPYLNAIDYMRGHKFSLIWFGYNLSSLSHIRSTAIGSERSVRSGEHKEFAEMLSFINLEDLNIRTRAMVNRYYADLRSQLVESKRVLKKGKSATFVIGNSSIKGDHIQNSEILKFAACNTGFEIGDEAVREIPNSRRYLPITVGKKNALSGRMRTEHIIEMVAT